MNNKCTISCGKHSKYCEYHELILCSKKEIDIQDFHSFAESLLPVKFRNDRNIRDLSELLEQFYDDERILMDILEKLYNITNVSLIRQGYNKIEKTKNRDIAFTIEQKDFKFDKHPITTLNEKYEWKLKSSDVKRIIKTTRNTVLFENLIIRLWFKNSEETMFKVLTNMNADIIRFDESYMFKNMPVKAHLWYDYSFFATRLQKMLLDKKTTEIKFSVGRLLKKNMNVDEILHNYLSYKIDLAKDWDGDAGDFEQFVHEDFEKQHFHESVVNPIIKSHETSFEGILIADG